MRIAKSILLLLVSFLAALTPYGVFADNSTAVDFYQKGKELYYSSAEGMTPEKDKAIENLEKAVQLDPTLVDAHMLLGDAYWDKSFAYKSTAPESKKWQERAEIEYRKAVALGPQNPETHYKLLTVVNDAEREAVLSRIIALDPNHPHAHEVLARILDHKGNADQAILEYQRHIEINKKRSVSEDVFLRVAELLEKKGRKKEAIDIIEQYIDGEQKHIAASFLKRIDLKPYKEYKEFTTRMEKIKNYDDNQHVLKAYELLGEDKIPEAMKEFKAQIAVNPYNVKHYIEFGRQLEKKGRYEEALSVFNSLLDSDNSKDDKCRDLIWMVRDKKLFEKDKDFLQKVETICK